jgi:hypothetical protein
MRNLGLILLIPLAFVGIVLGAFTAVSVMENSRSEFATFEEMESAGMIARGWLPEYFPESATRILEGHNIDTNLVWAWFRYEPSEIQSIENICLRIAEDDGGAKFLCPPFDSRTSTMVLRNDGEAYYLSYENPLSLNLFQSENQDYPHY